MCNSLHSLRMTVITFKTSIYMSCKLSLSLSTLTTVYTYMTLFYHCSQWLEPLGCSHKLFVLPNDVSCILIISFYFFTLCSGISNMFSEHVIYKCIIVEFWGKNIIPNALFIWKAISYLREVSMRRFYHFIFLFLSLLCFSMFNINLFLYVECILIVCFL